MSNQTSQVYLGDKYYMSRSEKLQLRLLSQANPNAAESPGVWGKGAGEADGRGDGQDGRAITVGGTIYVVSRNEYVLIEDLVVGTNGATNGYQTTPLTNIESKGGDFVNGKTRRKIS